MYLRKLLALVLLIVPAVLAEGLPDLGDSSQSDFSAVQERRLGESIMREVRADRSYYDDAEATDYISGLGNRMVARGADSRQDFGFFLIRDQQINAFALPGGFIGVNTGLILAALSAIAAGFCASGSSSPSICQLLSRSLWITTIPGCCCNASI
jgi:predicted Zn-dependent protease